MLFASSANVDLPGNEKEKITIEVMGIAIEVEVDAICTEVQCGSEVSSTISQDIPVVCGNVTQATVENVVDQITAGLCALNTVCCVNGTLCVKQCGSRNLTWSCNNNILHVEFEYYQRCRELAN